MEMREEDRQFYGEFGPGLEETMQMVLRELERILQGITEDPEQAPFEHLISRIKSEESVKEKLLHRGHEVSVRSALIHLTDVLGVRVVTHFIGDIYEILDGMTKTNAWRVEQVKDYIATPKANGYRSLHVILRVPFGIDGIGEIGVEIQLRTIAMDCWAALEHQMRYKKNLRDSSLIFDELKRCADEMASADLTMQSIREILITT